MIGYENALTIRELIPTLQLIKDLPSKKFQKLESTKGVEYFMDKPLTKLRHPISQAFSNFFNAYAKAFHGRHGTGGSLFERNFKRIWIDDDTYFTKVIQYIHANPVHHGFRKVMIDWKYSSYNTMLSNQPTLVKRQAVLDWFGSVDWFKFYHSQPIQLKQHRYCIDWK